MTKFEAFSREAEQRKAFALRKDNGMDGNGQIPHEMWRRLIPIALEYDRGLGSMATLYTYILSKVNGKKENDRYMSAWPSVDRIAKETGIGKNRIAPISDALEAVGLLRTTYDYTSNKREKLYFPQYYSTLSDEEIHANMAEWKRKMSEKNKPKQAKK